MPEYVKDGAVLQCSRGSGLCRLKVTYNTILKLQDKLIATTKDKQPIANIPSFGKCSITDKTCTPSPIDWQGHHDKITVQDANLLLMVCTLPCTIGGNIKTVTSGQ